MRQRRLAPVYLLWPAILLLLTLSCTSIPPVRGVVAWEISPAEGYRDEKSYVTLEYSASDPSDEPIPAGGRLTVHLGYRDLEDANTAWFRFEVFEDSRILLRFDGEEGIPNVKGLDGYWWNDVQLDLPEPVAVEARLAVRNRKYDVDYIFNLQRRVSSR